MAFIGRTPTPVPLTSSDIPDLPATKITSGTFPALNASNLTNLDAADLSGTLPAISGANLTGIASDYVRLAGADNTAANSISFDGHFSSTYKYYRLYGRMMGNSNSYPEVRIMQSSSTISGSNYKYCGGGSQSNSGGSNNTQHFEGRGTNHIRLSVWNNQDINQTKDFAITISNPLKVVNERPSIQWDCWGMSESTEHQHVQGFAIYDSADNWSGITLIASDGDAGNKWIVDLYGLKHS